MRKYDRDAVEIYILDHIDPSNYGKYVDMTGNTWNVCLKYSKMSIKNISKGTG